MATADSRERYARKNEAVELRRAFDVLDLKRDGKLDAYELGQMFNKLGHSLKKSEVDEIIWEVDEDCDQCVTWAEFQAMYHRCRRDQTGHEPYGLFNVVQFVINDKENREVI
ncbi:hypothetical protein WJX73_002688 [Symbiochloris irregularis]|uniref:EF-hand domain-containing protein n=1 Tax=Symbiochloris irregularis TaxID=706552 RepID=A0AAW1PMW4_9CHLO